MGGYSTKPLNSPTGSAVVFMLGCETTKENSVLPILPNNLKRGLPDEQFWEEAILSSVLTTNSRFLFFLGCYESPLYKILRRESQQLEVGPCV